MKKLSAERLKTRARLRQIFQFSWRDTLIALGALLVTCGLCYLTRLFIGGSDYVPLFFVAMVFAVSRFTNGYLYGIASALLGTFVADYIFTYPHFGIDFRYSDSSFLYVMLLVVSVMTSALTSQVKLHEKMRAEAEREKMRADLLRSVSHDLRTPLTSIVGATSAVCDNLDVLPPDKVRELLSGARDDAEWLIRIVENLLSITRMDSQRAELITQDEAAEEVIAEAAGKFRKRFPDVKLKVGVPDALVTVPMDATLIEQVLLNLLENAATHGKTTTQIDIRLSQSGGDAVFSVADNGSGIPGDAMAHLFESYFTHSDNRRNMGIGLSVCRAVVSAHGGTLKAENTRGGGAKFTFTLPLGKEKNFGDQG